MPVAIDWLETLEEKVREAAERIAVLREENQGLAAKVRELEARSALSGSTGAAESLAGELAGERLEGDRLREQIRGLEARLEDAGKRLEDAGKRLEAAEEGRERWTRERDEVRGRVERLVEHLDGLLQEQGPP